MANGTLEFFFTPYVLMLIPRKCHDEFFVNFNFFDVPCLKIALAKALGYSIILGSAMVKIPQLIKVLNARSVVGLSLLALLAELAGMTFNMAYSVSKLFPFSSWGESMFMTIQNMVLVTLYFKYTGHVGGMLLFSPAFCGFAYVLCSGLTPASVLQKLQGSTVFILAFSKLLQIFSNFRNGHTGQLSAITVFLLLGGSLARVFTTIQETGDALMLSCFLVACSLNTVLWIQILYYWNVTPMGEKVKRP